MDSFDIQSLNVAALIEGIPDAVVVSNTDRKSNERPDVLRLYAATPATAP
jgi:hypothetical protein